MKLQFDANQQFQLDAIEAVCGLFAGQPRGGSTYSVIRLGEGEGLFAGQDHSELGLGNRLLIDDASLLRNLRTIQRQNEIDVIDEAPLEAWGIFDAPADVRRQCPHFSVEMETGTGKTYVYLRSILELNRRYGYAKFVIVVPSVAIREGVLNSIEVTADHFRSLYDSVALEYFVYDAKHVNRLRQFATSNTLQIAIVNIDAFRKNFSGTEDEHKSNVMFKESDRLSGRQPIEFIQAARPIVIIDEPQSVDNTEKAQEAIMALNPLCTLRYSATHRNPYNLVYRLDPIKAFELRLVKKIVVASASAEGAAGDAFIRVESIEHRPTVRAKLRVEVQMPDGPKQKTLPVRGRTDLVNATGREAYRGYDVAEIYAEPGAEFIRFSNGVQLGVGGQIGGVRDDIWRVQIEHTVRAHLDRELRLQHRRVKVLSLFFVDRVANYRDYDSAGHPVAGKFAATFEEVLAKLAKEEKYKSLTWLLGPMDRVHNGYFASDKSHRLKDTSGATLADDDAYTLIMRDKERLLSIEEPLRFIFSHSALREGWDNPNVFQICTLNEGRSAVKKRQEIGRGLRLPVDADGKRIFDESVNTLYIMANESYEEFARTLQTEYETDCGVTFGKIPLRALASLTRDVGGCVEAIGDVAAASLMQALIERKMLDSEGRIGAKFDPSARDFALALPPEFAALEAVVIDLLSSYRIERHVRRERDEGQNRLKKEVLMSPQFQELWNRIRPKTTYRVEFDSDVLVAAAAREVAAMGLISAPIVRVSAGRLDPKRGGVNYRAVSSAAEVVDLGSRALPDILAYLQEQTELTRSTIYRILHESGRLGDFFVNPQRFMDAVAAIMRNELHKLMIQGIKYERVPGYDGDEEWQQWRTSDVEVINFLSSVKVANSVYDFVPYESEVEKRFAQDLDARVDIKLFVKLPGWFEIATPVGKYNPDWAIVKGDESVVYLVRETKSTHNAFKRRSSENDKVRCGKAHFDALGISFSVATSALEV